MKSRKDVPVKDAGKKPVRKKKRAIRSRLKAGNHWEDIESG